MLTSGIVFLLCLTQSLSVASREPSDRNFPIIGWVETALFQFGAGDSTRKIELKIKIDSGANTSSLNAINIIPFKRKNLEMVRFTVPNDTSTQPLELPLLRTGLVKSSEGEEEGRFFVNATICIGNLKAPITVSLNDRSQMRFPALVGRRFLEERFIIDVNRKHVFGKPNCR